MSNPSHRIDRIEKAIAQDQNDLDESDTNDKEEWATLVAAIIEGKDKVAEKISERHAWLLNSSRTIRCRLSRRPLHSLCTRLLLCRPKKEPNSLTSIPKKLRNA